MVNKEKGIGREIMPLPRKITREVERFYNELKATSTEHQWIWNISDGDRKEAESFSQISSPVAFSKQQKLFIYNPQQ